MRSTLLTGAFRLMTASLLASMTWFVATTIHWPVTGDAALMHYIAFLIAHGWDPYRDIADINFPGSYLPDMLVGRFLGTTAAAWRVYDLSLLAAIAAAIWAIARRYGVFVPLWAGFIFALVHGRDGLNQVGQRDLTGTALVLLGFACLLAAKRKDTIGPALLWGLCLGAAASIKPTFLLFLLVGQLDLLQTKPSRQAVRRMALTVVGCLVVPAACLLWLGTEGGLQAFWYTAAVLTPYHAGLGHATWRFLLYNSVSPLLPVVLLWSLVVVLGRATGIARKQTASLPSTERHDLWAAAAVGYLCYLLQAKGYPYHRYPFLAFVLVLIAIDLVEAAKEQGSLKWPALAALLWSSFIFAPSSAWKTSHYDWRHQEPQQQIQADLMQLAGPSVLASLNGRIQCLDSISGCLGALGEMKLVQQTGTLYDEFLFNPATARPVQDARATFWQSVLSNPPLVFIVTDPLFPSGPNSYGKLTQWPQFSEWLDRNYKVQTDRQPTIPRQGMGRMVLPTGYRLYVRKTE